MNQNTPPQSGDAPLHGNPPQRDSFAGNFQPETANPYAARYQQAQQARQPDLDAGAPQLRSDELRRMNRRAVVFLVILVALLTLTAAWMFNNALRGKDKPRPQEEVVTVAEAPKPQLPPLPPPLPAQAIPLAPMAAPAPSMPPPPPQSSLLERRIMAADPAAVGVAGGPDAIAPEPFSGLGAMGAASDLPPNTAYPPKPLSPTSNAQPLLRPDTLMVRGTYIRCVLETHIVTDIPGFTSCVVTEPIYSVNGKRLLLPKGSKVLGQYETEPNGPRVAVIWDRVITPTGIDVSMASPGVDNLGGAGHPGHRDEHWVSRVGAAMLISLLSDAFKYAAAENGPSATTISAGGLAVQSPYESNTAQTLQNIANQAVRRAANRPATVTIHQGTVLNVYVARDVDFSAVVARYR